MICSKSLNNPAFLLLGMALTSRELDEQIKKLVASEREWREEKAREFKQKNPELSDEQIKGLVNQYSPGEEA